MGDGAAQVSQAACRKNPDGGVRAGSIVTAYLIILRSGSGTYASVQFGHIARSAASRARRPAEQK